MHRRGDLARTPLNSVKAIVESLIYRWEKEEEIHEKAEIMKSAFEMLLAILRPEAYQQIKRDKEARESLDMDNVLIEEKFPKQSDIESVKEITKILKQLEEKKKKENEIDDYIDGL